MTHLPPSSRPEPSEARRSGGTFFARFTANPRKKVPPLRAFGASVGTTGGTTTTHPALGHQHVPAFHGVRFAAKAGLDADVLRHDVDRAAGIEPHLDADAVARLRTVDDCFAVIAGI